MIRWHILLIMLLPILANAAIEDRQFDTLEHEKRYHEIIDKLRCLVCQNQNLADSNAELAKDLRDKTYTMIVAGNTNSEITDYMVARYGDFVLYEPPVNTRTILLWLAPLIFFLFGAGFFIAFSRRQRHTATPEVSAANLEKAQRLLDSEEKQ
jgi:cytochrome c-type biogenesis protein CcmH